MELNGFILKCSPFPEGLWPIKLSALFFFPLCLAIVAFPHITKVEAGSPPEAGERLEFPRSRSGMQPSAMGGTLPLSRKDAYSCFLFSETSLITSLSKLINSLQTKKCNHCYCWWSLMHAFPFPPPCNEARKGCCSFLSSSASHTLHLHDGPAAGHGLNDPKRRGEGLGAAGGFLVAAQAWPKLHGVQAFQAIPYPGPTPCCTPGLMQTQIWTWATCFRPALATVPSGGTALCLISDRQSLGLQKLGNQSKNRCFSKSLFFSSVLLPYSVSR